MTGIFWTGMAFLVIGVGLGAAGGAVDAMRGARQWKAPVMMAFGFVIAVIGVVFVCGAGLIASFAGAH